LQSSLELVLIMELAGIYSALDFFKTGNQIHCRLLVASWRILQVFEGALELQCVVPILDEPSAYGRVEGDSDPAVIDINGPGIATWTALV
jgi:hypothetical protein